MKIFITGATGFLGTALTKKLKEDGHHVVAINSRIADLMKDNSLDPFTDQKFDILYHLAAWTQAGDFCLYHPGEQWIINQKINSNVLDWWHQFQPQSKIITIGTSCSYPPGSDMKEENYLTGTPIESLYTYAMTKRMMQIGLESIHKQFGLKYLTVIPSTLYGPHYHHDGRQMHFIFDLIRKIIRGKEYGEPVVLWGDGHQKRELVYIQDFISILLKLVPVAENEIINIGAGEEYSIRYFANLICNLLDYDFNKIQFDTTKYVGAKSKCLGITKLRKLQPDYQPSSLESGLKATINWFYKDKGYMIP